MIAATEPVPPSEILDCGESGMRAAYVLTVADALKMDWSFLKKGRYKKASKRICPRCNVSTLATSAHYCNACKTVPKPPRMCPKCNRNVLAKGKVYCPPCRVENMREQWRKSANRYYARNRVRILARMREAYAKRVKAAQYD